MYLYITLRRNSTRCPQRVVNLSAHYCTPPGMTAHSAVWTLINFNNPCLGTGFFSKLFCYNYHLGKAKQLFSTTELGKETQVHSTLHSTLGTVLNIHCSSRWHWSSVFEGDTPTPQRSNNQLFQRDKGKSCLVLVLDWDTYIWKFYDQNSRYSIL